MVSRLSVLFDDKTISFIQSRCPELTLLRELLLCAEDGVVDWPDSLKPFRRHQSHLGVQGDGLLS